jgi:hypothetical protein
MLRATKGCVKPLSTIDKKEGAFVNMIRVSHLKNHWSSKS